MSFTSSNTAEAAKISPSGQSVAPHRATQSTPPSEFALKVNSEFENAQEILRMPKNPSGEILIIKFT